MAFRARELYKKVVGKIGPEKMVEIGGRKAAESLKKALPDNKVVMGRAKRGIYAGRHIQFGNQISEDGGNKSRRTWKPNVQEKRLFSYIHGRHIQVKVTTHALRCIDKAGGIDEYFLNTPYHKMDTEMGLCWKLKFESLYKQFSGMSPEEVTKIDFARKEARREARRQQKQVSKVQNSDSVKHEQSNEVNMDSKTTD
ncbi:hypothetical protein QJS10_CPB17g00059 [Acorus calamus]|uniref:Large ribosomal subunit protein bL28m n=1 Tax=Acorus calamus TaxID=4465 RepID=A0AAV9CQR4_ACOCL|nr:hypothetical protein QJS10_CPB17g00059 [Acorus calamus]